eukprot:15359605-Ditylum_brightwellii.AAC.1
MVSLSHTQLPPLVLQFEALEVGLVVCTSGVFGAMSNPVSVALLPLLFLDHLLLYRPVALPPPALLGSPTPV